MPVAATPTVDHDAILASVRARVDLRDHRLTGLAERSLARLTPDRWPIEWRLPEWLGARFGLDADLVGELVESTVLGLLSIRLSDDLADSEVAERDIAPCRTLAALAYDEATQVYRRIFPEASPFWSVLAGSMQAWRAGADGAQHALRAAPIRIPAFACCLLAGRTDAWPELDRCLERAMTALVLYDAFVDWESDVAAGRWNAFVAGILPARSTAVRPERDRAAVLTTMLTRDVVVEHFGRIALEAEAAANLAAELALDALATHLRSWAAATASQGSGIASHYRRAADEATRLLFENALVTRSEGGPA